MSPATITSSKPGTKTCSIMNKKHRSTYLKHFSNVPTKSGTLTLHSTIEKTQPLLLVVVTLSQNPKLEVEFFQREIFNKYTVELEHH